MPTRRLMLLVLIALTAGCGGGSAEAPHEFRLDNGLTVLVRPLDGATEIAEVVLFPVGECHDPEGASGLGHLLEHGYVTARAGRTPGRTMTEYVARYGQGWNAQTGADYTVVACVFPPEQLEDELRDAASRLGDLHIEPADVAREQRRVLSELANMYRTMPALAAMNRARAAVRPRPRGGRKGGVPEHIERLTAEALQDRWAALYRANNATLVLAGAVDPAAVEERIAYYFGTLPEGEAVPAAPESPAPSLPAREIVGPAEGPLPDGSAACLAWAAPEPDDPHYAPFLVLVARLWRQAQTRGPLHAMPQARFAPLDDPDVIFIQAAVAGSTADEALAALQAFVDTATAAELTREDVNGARGAFGLVLGLPGLPERALAQNPYGVAFGIGRRRQLGLAPAELADALEAVTNDDLRRAAETVFATQRRAAAVVAPPASAGTGAE